MTGTVGAPPGLSSPGPSPSNGANAEMDARQISAKIAQQVQTLLQQLDGSKGFVLVFFADVFVLLSLSLSLSPSL